MSCSTVDQLPSCTLAQVFGFLPRAAEHAALRCVSAGTVKAFNAAVRQRNIVGSAASCSGLSAVDFPSTRWMPVDLLYGANIGVTKPAVAAPPQSMGHRIARFVLAPFWKPEQLLHPTPAASSLPNVKPCVFVVSISRLPKETIAKLHGVSAEPFGLVQEPHHPYVEEAVAREASRLSIIFCSGFGIALGNLPAQTLLLEDVDGVVRSIRDGALVEASETLQHLRLRGFANLKEASAMIQACPACTTVELPPELPSLTTLNSFAPSCTALRSIVVPRLPSLRDVSGSWFRECHALQSVSFPNSLPALEKVWSWFWNCPKLETLTLPDGLPRLEVTGIWFRGCASLVRVCMPSSLPRLSQHFELGQTESPLACWFDGCPALVEVDLPEELPLLNQTPVWFSRCPALIRVLFPPCLPALRRVDTWFVECPSLGDVRLPSVPQIDVAPSIKQDHMSPAECSSANH